MPAVAENYEQTHTHAHTWDSHSDANNEDYLKRCNSIVTYAKPLNMKHMR